MLDLFELVVFRALSQLLRPFSYRSVSLFGGWLGSFGFRWLRIRRTVTMENLRHAFREKTEQERERIAEGAYRNFGIAMVQLLWSLYASEEELRNQVRIPDREELDRCLGSGKGIVLLSAHFGGWEFFVQGLRLQIGRPMDSVVQRQRNKYIDRIIDRQRRRHGNGTIAMGVQSRQALTTLRSGNILGILGDQSGPKESLFIDFFGRPAATHRGPAAFSLRTGSPILFAVLVRQPDGTYDALFERIPCDDLHGHSDQAILELTTRHVRALERRIREYPDHWLWMHKRWKHIAHAPTRGTTA